MFFTSLGLCAQTVCDSDNAECASSCEFEHNSYSTDVPALIKPIYTQAPFVFFDKVFVSTQFVKLIDHPPIIA
ncbi:MAG: hypothetical protein M0Q46_04765 [Endomicrobiales bacterium]|nr:hypothetical protein [Endomicrobiales bacterium]